ncbi:MAG: ISAs1 family transposase, partial [Phycisphaerae bacterium]
ALKPEAFQESFEYWIASLVNEHVTGKGIVAIDGKTLRRSHDQKNGLGPLHLVSAWATDNGLSLGQVATEEKSNEITAIPALIDRIDVKGATVTIDAMGCQKEIAQRIVHAGGDYVLAVKDNQPKLHEAIKTLFSDERQADLLKMATRECHTVDTSHGRKDERCYYSGTDHLDTCAWPCCGCTNGSGLLQIRATQCLRVYVAHRDMCTYSVPE